MTSTVAEPDRGPTDSAELDAYSRVVTSVAAELTASVAARSSTPSAPAAAAWKGAPAPPSCSPTTGSC